jgi:hypothetical protein
VTASAHYLGAAAPLGHGARVSSLPWLPEWTTR